MKIYAHYTAKNIYCAPLAVIRTCVIYLSAANDKEHVNSFNRFYKETATFAAQC